MSRALRGVIRIAAWSLPAGVKDRYREEWLADVAGAREAGIDASSIAAGAVLFSVTLRRDTPDVLGVPLTVAARRHARWGTALLLSALVFAFGSFLTGGFSTGSGGALAVAATVWGGLTAAATVLGLIALWRAALLASPLARIAAATLTTAAAAFASLTVIPQSSVVGVLMVPVGLLLGIAGAVVGLVAWAGSGSLPAAESTSPRVSGSKRQLVIAALVVGGLFLAALLFLFTGLGGWLAIVGVPAIALLLAVFYVIQARRTVNEPAPRVAWLAVLVTGAGAVATVVIGGLDLLVWSPLAIAPGYTLEEIWAALTPADLAVGIGSAVGWIVFWSLITVAYIAGAVVVLGRAGRPSSRMFAAAGLLLIAGAVFFQFIAGFSLGMSISDTLPPYVGGGSDIRAWYAMAGQLALVASLILSIAPRPLPTVRTAAA